MVPLEIQLPFQVFVLSCASFRAMVSRVYKDKVFGHLQVDEDIVALYGCMDSGIYVMYASLTESIDMFY